MHNGNFVRNNMMYRVISRHEQSFFRLTSTFKSQVVLLLVSNESVVFADRCIVQQETFYVEIRMIIISCDTAWFV